MQDTYRSTSRSISWQPSLGSSVLYSSVVIILAQYRVSFITNIQTSKQSMMCPANTPEMIKKFFFFKKKTPLDSPPWPRPRCLPSTVLISHFPLSTSTAIPRPRLRVVHHRRWRWCWCCISCCGRCGRRSCILLISRWWNRCDWGHWSHWPHRAGCHWHWCRRRRRRCRDWLHWGDLWVRRRVRVRSSTAVDFVDAATARVPDFIG